MPSKPPSKLSIWAREVTTRDGKCLHCGATEPLHAIHKHPKSTHPTLSLDPSNGFTLCLKCRTKHYTINRIPRLGRYKNPTKKSLWIEIARLNSILDRQSALIDRLKHPAPK